VFPEQEREKIVNLATQTIKSPEGQEAKKYLNEERGISDSVIDQFQVGYCPARIRHELSNRIITPVCDPYGSVVALSSRHLKNKKNFFHESYEKSLFLYGLHVAKEAILKYKKVVIVEGEFDVLFMHSNKLPITVGMCGSALSIFQIALLIRYCCDIYIVFDADDKREISIKRVMEMYRNHLQKIQDINFFPVRLPMGYDPDDFIRDKGRTAFLNLLRQTKGK
jgi:DNA primase